MSMYFFNTTLSYNLMKLPTLAFINIAFESKAAIFCCTLCLAMKKRKTGLIKLSIKQFGKVVSYTSLE